MVWASARARSISAPGLGRVGGGTSQRFGDASQRQAALPAVGDGLGYRHGPLDQRRVGSSGTSQPSGDSGQLKTWRILRKLRCCPWRAGQLAKAIHALQVREANAG